MQPTNCAQRKGSSSMESIKRMREGYHFDIRLPLRKKILRTSLLNRTAVQSPRPSCHVATLRTFSPHDRGPNKNICHNPHDFDRSFHIELGKALVHAIRADSGRHVMFYVRPSFWFKWELGQKSESEPSSGSRVGIALEEKIRLAVFHVLPQNPMLCGTSMATYPLNSSTFSVSNNEEEQGHPRDQADLPSLANEESYSYQATHIRSVSHSASLEQGLDALNWTSALSSALLADCLLKVLKDECFLAADISHYSFLYQGHRLTSERGHRLLCSDFISQCMALSNVSRYPIRVCVFSKF